MAGEALIANHFGRWSGLQHLEKFLYIDMTCSFLMYFGSTGDVAFKASYEESREQHISASL